MKLIEKALQLKPKLSKKDMINRFCPSKLDLELVQNFDQHCSKTNCEACWDREG